MIIVCVCVCRRVSAYVSAPRHSGIATPNGVSACEYVRSHKRRCSLFLMNCVLNKEDLRADVAQNVCSGAKKRRSGIRCGVVVALPMIVLKNGVRRRVVVVSVGAGAHTHTLLMSAAKSGHRATKNREACEFTDCEGFARARALKYVDIRISPNNRHRGHTRGWVSSDRGQ